MPQFAALLGAGGAGAGAASGAAGAGAAGAGAGAAGAAGGSTAAKLASAAAALAQQRGSAGRSLMEAGMPPGAPQFGQFGGGGSQLMGPMGGFAQLGSLLQNSAFLPSTQPSAFLPPPASRQPNSGAPLIPPAQTSISPSGLQGDYIDTPWGPRRDSPGARRLQFGGR